MAMNGFEWFALVGLMIPLVTLVVGLIVAYFVIRMAVRDGMREALRDDSLRSHTAAARPVSPCPM